MAITLTLPLDGSYSVNDIQDIIGFVVDDSETTTTSATEFSGSGTFNGVSATFVATGTNLGYTNIFGDIYVTSGMLDTITVNAGGEEVTMTSINIDMAEFADAIRADLTGVSPLAIENFLLDRAWTFNLGNSADIAPEGTLIGDGAALNFTDNDIFRGRGGNDDLFAGDGNDRMYGNGGRDILSGGDGNDKLFGNSGKDVLIGGTGNDLLVGGGGTDRFVFADGFGADRVRGFNANNNREDIDLSDVASITRFRDLARNHMEQVGRNVEIDAGDGNVITLLRVDIDDLGNGDFIF